MTLNKVESSLIKEVAYENGVLIVKFNTDAIYAYSGVPVRVYSEFIDASSVGRYFLQNIKEVYTYCKLA